MEEHRHFHSGSEGTPVHVGSELPPGRCSINIREKAVWVLCLAGLMLMVFFYTYNPGFHPLNEHGQNIIAEKAKENGTLMSKEVVMTNEVVNEVVMTEEVVMANEVVKTNETTSRPMFILLLTYMRGGSTLLAEIFNQNEDVIHWFEPVDSFYYHMTGARGWAPIDLHFYSNGSRRYIGPEEAHGLITYLHGLLNCNQTDMLTALQDSQVISAERQRQFADLLQCQDRARKQSVLFSDCHKKVQSSCIPQYNSKLNHCTENVAINSWNDREQNVVLGLNVSETGSTNFSQEEDYFAYKACVRRQIDVNIKCLPTITSVCNASKIVSAKVIRVRLGTLLKYLTSYPTANIKVVYYVRDPRGIINSRRKGGAGVTSLLSGQRNYKKETNHLCQMIADDIDDFIKMIEVFPSRIIMLRYEDLVFSTLDFFHKLEEFLGVTFPDYIRKNIQMMTKPRKGNMSDRFTKQSFSIFRETPAIQTYSIFRSNPQQSASSWRSELPLKLQMYARKVCKRAIDFFNYDQNINRTKYAK